MSFIMSGTEGSKEYTVIAKNSAGRLGVRTTSGGSLRIRLEPEHDSASEVFDATLDGNWSRPDDEQDRFSRVVSQLAAPEVVRCVLALLTKAGGKLEINPHSKFFDIAKEVAGPVATPAPAPVKQESNLFENMVGSCGYADYTTVVSVSPGTTKVGVKSLGGGQYRVRVTASSRYYFAQYLSAEKGWKQPVGTYGGRTDRFSKVGGLEVLEEAVARVKSGYFVSSIEYNPNAPSLISATGVVQVPAPAPVAPPAPVVPKAPSAGELLAKAAANLATVASDIAAIAATLK